MSRIVRLIACGLVVPALLGAQGSQKKIRIAILDFEYEGVRSQVEEMFGSDVDIGQGIADLVAAELGKSNRYELAPRASGPAAERADPGAAGQAVTRLGVDVVVMGSVLGYGKAEGQEAGVNLRVGRVGIGGIGRQRSIAAVSLSVQVLGPGGQPLLIAAGNGQATGSETALLGNVKVAGLSVGGRVNLSGDEYRKSTIGQATTQAVADLAKVIESGYQDLLRGLTPAAPVAAPAPMPQPAVAAAPVPAAYGAPITGPFVWGMYQFKGTEHFRYTATQTDDDGKKDGWYTLDATPAANGMFQLTVAGALGTDSFRSSSTVQPGQGIPMMQLAAMGPGALVLFSPMYMFFGGQQWSVGNEWTFTQDGETVSFKVESTCAYAGVSGLRGVWRQNNETRLDMCVSPNVALPLAVAMLDEDGESYQLTLVEFRP
jgi:curli biogenesis system outer membrane secretion channel CsgG